MKNQSQINQNRAAGMKDDEKMKANKSSRSSGTGASGVNKSQGTSQGGTSGGNLGGNQGGPRGGSGKGNGGGKRP